MPSRKPSNEGERIASLAAAFEQFEKYEHERWHKLNNDLQPIVNLPRDLGKLEGRLRGEMSATADKMERMVEEVVAKALAPVNSDISELQSDVAELKGWKREQTGERGLIKAILQSPILMWAVMLAGIAWAALTGRLK